MDRKKFLKKGLLSSALIGTGLTGCIPAPDAPGAKGNKNQAFVHQGKKYQWKMVTTWPPNFPTLGESANMFADLVQKMSGGRINIKVFGGGELVPPLEVFDNVSSGAVEMGCGAAYYWSGKTPAAQFFTAVPFGMNAQQITAWIVAGGGYELWKEVYAKFNLVPFLAGNTGVQMGGWFNKEINTVADLRGLKMRIPGLGGKVLEKAGGAAVLVAGSEVYTSLERGVIDAAEWIGPYHDLKMGFQRIAKYYYTPGWHEPGSELEFTMNKNVYDNLPEDLQYILSAASMQVHTWVTSEFETQNAKFLKEIKEDASVEIRTFPEEVLEELRKHTSSALDEIIGSDPLSKKVKDSYFNYLETISDWSKITEKAYYNSIQQ